MTRANGGGGTGGLGRVSTVLIFTAFSFPIILVTLAGFSFSHVSSSVKIRLYLQNKLTMDFEISSEAIVQGVKKMMIKNMQKMKENRIRS